MISAAGVMTSSTLKANWVQIAMTKELDWMIGARAQPTEAAGEKEIFIYIFCWLHPQKEVLKRGVPPSFYVPVIAKRDISIRFFSL